MISQKSSLNRANYSNVLHVLKNKKKMLKPFPSTIITQTRHTFNTNSQFPIYHATYRSKSKRKPPNFSILNQPPILQ